jgi:hypothetical protein
MKSTISAIIVRENGKYERREISNDLKSLQEIVGGYIETWTLPHEKLVAIFDEEGVFKEKPVTMHLPIAGWILGTVVLAGTECEDFTDAPEGLEKRLSKQLGAQGLKGNIITHLCKEA